MPAADGKLEKLHDPATPHFVRTLIHPLIALTRCFVHSLHMLALTPPLPRLFRGHRVEYTWRNSAATPEYAKGAYIVKLNKYGREFYAGVGYNNVPLPPVWGSSALFQSTGASDNVLGVVGESASALQLTSSAADTQSLFDAMTNFTVDADTAYTRPGGFAVLVLQQEKARGGGRGFAWRIVANGFRPDGCALDQLYKNARESVVLDPKDTDTQGGHATETMVRMASAKALAIARRQLNSSACARSSLVGMSVVDAFHRFTVATTWVEKITSTAERGGGWVVHTWASSSSSVTSTTSTQRHSYATRVISRTGNDFVVVSHFQSDPRPALCGAETSFEPTNGSGCPQHATGACSVGIPAFCECKAHFLPKFTALNAAASASSNGSVPLAIESAAVSIDFDMACFDDPATEDSRRNYIPDGLKGAVLAVTALTIGLALFCLVWTFRHRRSPIVLASQPPFLAFIVAGCILSTSSVVALGIDDRPEPGDTVDIAQTRADTACLVSVWFYVSRCQVRGVCMVSTHTAHVLLLLPTYSKLTLEKAYNHPLDPLTMI